MKRKFLLTALLTVLLTGGCIYDFDPQVEGGQQFLVVEGDILVGDMSEFTVSWTRDLSALADEATRYEPGSLRIVCDDGSSLEALSMSGRFLLDTRGLSPDRKYRVELSISGDNVCTDWLEVHKAGVLDSLNYVIDPLTKEQMWICVTAHAEDSDEKYFRWRCEETWEYHAQYMAGYYYVKDSRYGKVLPFENGENTFWCWKEGRVSDIMVASTADLSDPRFICHKLYSIGNTESKASYLYSPQVVQTAVSEEAYRYWAALSRNTADVGGLFSPQPSECRGNLRSERNPDKLVLGYVSASTVAKKRIFVSEGLDFFYKGRSSGVSPEYIAKELWPMKYSAGMRPYQPHYVEGADDLDPIAMDMYEWLPSECVECTRQGGTKNKPVWWPNDHK